MADSRISVTDWSSPWMDVVSDLRVNLGDVLMFFFVEGSLCLVSIKKKPNTHFVGPKPPTKPKALCCETGSARRRLLSINQKKKKLLKKKIKKKKKGYARRRSVRLRPTGKRVPKSAMCGIALVLSGDCLVVASSTAAATAAAASGTPFSDEVLSLASVKTYQSRVKPLPVVVSQTLNPNRAKLYTWVQGKGVSVGELEEALRRRGPDSLGCHRLHLCVADGTIVGATGGGSLTNVL